jgi:hypothetical protein
MGGPPAPQIQICARAARSHQIAAPTCVCHVQTAPRGRVEAMHACTSPTSVLGQQRTTDHDGLLAHHIEGPIAMTCGNEPGPPRAR